MATRYVVSTSQTIHDRLPTRVNDLVMDRADTETSEVFIVVLEPSEGPPLHARDDTEQILYVLEGTGVLQIGETHEPHQVQAGEVVRIPPQTLLQTECPGPNVLRRRVPNSPEIT